jgi:deoxyribodipyrimidine photolyase-related protein
MKRSLFLFSYQLHPQYLKSFLLNKELDTIYFIDSDDQWTYYQFHKQRIIVHLSSYYHYYHTLKNQGYHVVWISHTSLVDALKPIENLYAFTPTNFYELGWLRQLQSITLLDDPLFFVTPKEWRQLLPVNQSWKLDPIYRQLRIKFNILMDDRLPVGGKFSYDTENRKPAAHTPFFIPPLAIITDQMTETIIESVHQRFPHHPGKTDSFAYPVTRDEALEFLKHFIEFRLPTFGDHQDAMIDHQPWMSHSLISSSLNLGLLSPKEVILEAEHAYRQGKVPLASVEGFIRQILGWREYVRGIYLQLGPDYIKENFLKHHEPLPDFYYSGETDKYCLSTTIHETIDHGYNHHIQRLMVLSNYASLKGISPQALQGWFNEMYIDSFEWIVAPNVIGMGSFADGGKMSTKPYISSGAYIQKMSNYCQSCVYKVALKSGEKACPFNILYWDYLDRHKETLKNNPRMTMMLAVWNKMDATTKENLKKEAQVLIQKHE